MTDRSQKTPRLLDKSFDDRGVSKKTQHIFLIMSRRAHVSGECFMSIDRIANESGWSRSSVSRAIAELTRLRRLIETNGKAGRATRTFRVLPGGHDDPRWASERIPLTGQNDLQNPKLNQKENPDRPVDDLRTSPRRGRASPIGKIVEELHVSGEEDLGKR